MELSQSRREAIEHLIQNSSLHHSPQFQNYFKDTGVDIIQLKSDHLRWSSGERVLVEVVKILSTYWSDLKLSDLWNLDNATRIVVLESIDQALTGRSPSSRIL